MATLGAIRWDIGGYNTTSSDIGENNTLRNPLYHGRAPFYATVKNTNSLDIVATQATMDQEIAFALAGGLSYWAVLRYINLSPGNVDRGLDLYQSSTARGALKWCSIEQIGNFGGVFGGTPTWQNYIGRVISEAQQSHYFKVQSNRPLIYLYYDAPSLNTWFGGSLTDLKSALDAIRSGIVSAGLGTPYIAMMGGNQASDNTTRVTLGLDALTAYVTNLPATRNAAYTELDSTAQAFWASQAAVAGKVVPTVMTGWSPQPRIVRAVPWQATSTRPRVGLDRVVQPATDAEMAAHIAAARTYVTNNPTICDAGTIIAYSWNEFGEGHRPLCPTRSNPTGTHLSGIAAALA
jgi:hypothetical protein